MSLGVAVGSIPLYIAASQNRRKASTALSLPLEACLSPPSVTGAPPEYPALGLRLTP